MRRGFTLVELLVAIAISAIIVLVLAAVTSGALKSSTTNNNSLIALSAANAALDLLANDLNSLAASGQPSPAGQTATAGPYEFLQARPDPNTGNLNGATPALLMLNAASAQDSISNSSDLGIQPRAICYQLAFQDPVNSSNTNTAAKIYGLYRTVQTGSATFANFLGQSDLYGTSSGSQWGKLATALPSTNSFIVGNVTDFQLVFYACRLSSTGQLLTVPVAVYSTALAGAGNSLHLTSTGYTISNTSANLDSAYGHGPMVYADVTIVVLDSSGAVRLTSEAITPARLTAAKTLYGHTLTRRVSLRQPF